MKRFFAGLILGLVGGIFALQNHVVRTNDGVIVIARTSRPPIMTSYLDVRDWSVTMWEQYPEVATAVVKAGRTDLLTQNVLGSFLNGAPDPGQRTPATSTSSLMDAPLKFLQGKISSPPPVTGEQVSPQTVTGILDQISTSVHRPSASSEIPAGSIPDTVLGTPGSFPAHFLSPDAAGLVLPQGVTSVLNGLPEASTFAQPAQGALSPQGNTIPQTAPAPIQDRAAGQDPEWVRGLLRSLVPTEGVTAPTSQGTTTGLSAPTPGSDIPPSAAAELIKAVTFEKQFESAAPLREIRPF